MTVATKGVLLVNLGTPDDPSVSSVRRYLREFLLDPRVIDLPPLLRYALVYGVILPFRPRSTAKAYQKIWQTTGSPLRLHSMALAKAVGDTLGQSFQVEVAMRYGNPSIAGALAKLHHCQELVVLPLFPQYASAATGSAIEKTLCELSRQWTIPHLKVINQFYAHPGFIHPLAHSIKAYLSDPETFLVLSYHGLPERHLLKSGCQTPCRTQACARPTAVNAHCYRAQCYETSRLVAHVLGLAEDRYCTAFQSRLGRLPWIQPYFSDTLPRLYAQGVRKLVVACPAFTADCLETLEEIGMQAREQWRLLGGSAFELVPCLNSDPGWVEGVAALILDHCADGKLEVE